MENAKRQINLSQEKQNTRLCTLIQFKIGGYDYILYGQIKVQMVYFMIIWYFYMIF